MLDDLPVVFPKGVCHPSYWKPTRRCCETKNGRPAGHIGVDGPQDSRCLGTVARLWNRAAHRADQRRSAGRESRDSVSRAVEAGARRRDHIRVGRLREQSQGALLSTDPGRTQAVAGRDRRLGTNSGDHRAILRCENGGFVMKSLRRFLNRLFNSATRRPQEERLREEIGEHIALQTKKNLRAGFPPVGARRKAMLKFGGVEAMKQDYRAERGFLFIENLLGDLRNAGRTIGRMPGLAAVIVVSLAIGIGVNTTIFSWIQLILWEPLHGVSGAANFLLVAPRSETGG